MRKVLAAKPSITQLEKDYVNDAVATGWGADYCNYLNRFKDKLREYFDVPYVWPVSSCHGALHISLMALGIGPGDEVIVPDLTWVGSAFPVSWLGAKPVFVDCNRDDWCIDVDKIRKALTEKTKAIIVVHLYGNLCEMDAIGDIARDHGLYLIEDAAEAIGSKYKGRQAGVIGDIGVFSLHGTKTLTTGEGGIVVTASEELNERIHPIENQGRRPEKHNMLWVDEIGLKYKMANMIAAMGLAQFERAGELIANKREVFSKYKRLLDGVDDIAMNAEPEHVFNAYWQPTVVFGKRYGLDFEKRNELIHRVNQRGVALRPVFYPLTALPMYRQDSGSAVAHEVSRSGINLPSYFDMTDDDIDYVVGSLKAALRDMEKLSE